MPYIAIKAWPKDEATQKELVERINAVLLEVWKCPPACAGAIRDSGFQ